MTNLIEANYNQTGQSKKTNHLGMREMQQMVYEKRFSISFSQSSTSFWKIKSFDVCSFG